MGWISRKNKKKQRRDSAPETLKEQERTYRHTFLRPFLLNPTTTTTTTNPFLYTRTLKTGIPRKSIL
jgi:hypothetical protein